MRIISLCRKFCPLFNAKSVLFVGNHKCKVIKLHRVLNYRMSSDNNVCDACRNQVICTSFFRSSHTSGKHYHRYTRTLEKFSQRFCMLSCKNFGRRHHCGLMTVFYGGINCRRRNSRFTAADITLNKSVHHLTALAILQNFIQSFLLCVCKRKRQIIRKFTHTIYIFKHNTVLRCIYILSSA